MLDITVDVDDIVLVVWRDAYFDFKLEDQADPVRDDYQVTTMGWVLSIGPRFLSIAQEKLPEGEGWRGVTHLPLQGLLHVRKLA